MAIDPDAYLPPSPSKENPIHWVSQEGQPYGSTRRCCSHCGRMYWPGMQGSAEYATSDYKVWSEHKFNCSKVTK